MTGAQLLARATKALTAAGFPDPGRDARRLLAHVLKVPTGRLTLVLPEPVETQVTVLYDVLINRRCERVPVSHLTGRRMFYGRDFQVSPAVLDPRPETETLIEVALSAPFQTVLDLGTGSGCIVLTLLAENVGARGLGIDLSAEALEVAFRNRTALGLEARAGLKQGSWFDPLTGQGAVFDLIVSNPPYIAASEMAELAPEVREYEPRLALTDEDDGLSAYRLICAQAPRFLIAGGRLVFEIGATQGARVQSLLETHGFQDVQIIQDLDARDRVVSGTKPR
ncbi:MAG: peptide chain release factor N(5)-glutamine methyltransferase [Rhodobacteraceae bacterium]|nr:peptide chain release factor N(5)-glutamine methyltransferase [Paracoccaceae bacterium]